MENIGYCFRIILSLNCVSDHDAELTALLDFEANQKPAE